MAGDDKLNERVAALEATMNAVMPEMRENIRELKDLVRTLTHTISEDLSTKATKQELSALTKKVEDLQRQVWKWVGAVGVLTFIAGIVGSKLIALLG